MRPSHKTVHAACPWGAETWGACDKARDDVYADWQAMQQVLLVYRLLAGKRDELSIKRMKKEGQLGALMRYMDGNAPDIMNDEGNPSQSPWVLRLRAAAARAMAGDLPEYNLYATTAPAVPAITQEGT